MTEELRNEILETYRWIKVSPYKLNHELSWEERYKSLEKHHIEETTFLIEEIRKLVIQSPIK